MLLNVPIARDALKNGTARNKRIKLQLERNNQTVVEKNDFNPYLIKESFRFIEKMASTDTLEFGLCEASGVEFEYMNDGTFNIFVGDVVRFVYIFQIPDSAVNYMIDIGTFIVTSCTKNSRIGSHKITAYDRLADAKFNDSVHSILAGVLSETFSNKFISVLTVKQKVHDYLEVPLPNYHYVDTPVTYSSMMPNVILTFWKSGSDGLVDPNNCTSFYQNYGFVNPINPYVAGLDLNNTSKRISCQLNMSGISYFLDPSKQYKVTLDLEKLNAFESNLETLLDSWFNTNALKIMLNGEEVLDTHSYLVRKIFNGYKSSNSEWGWTEFLYAFISSGLVQVKATRYDPLESYDSETWLSDDFVDLFTNIFHFDADDCVDCIRKGTLEDVNSIVFTGYKAISLCLPIQLRLYTPDNTFSPTNIDLISNTQYTTYRYYTDSWSGSTNEGSFANPGYAAGIYSMFMPTFVDLFKVEEITDASSVEKLEISYDGLKNVVARDFIASEYELNCRFGLIKRTTNEFVSKTLNTNALYPAEELYPATNLYPSNHGSGSEHVVPAAYERLWAEPNTVKKFRNLIAYYSKFDDKTGEQRILTKSKVVNNDGNIDYYMNNEILMNVREISSSVLQSIVDNMAGLMQDISWVPFELWCVGLPYLEVGDRLEINDGETTRMTYILQRELRGLQTLHDTFINGNVDIY